MAKKDPKKKKTKRIKPRTRLNMPPNKRHKTAKDYKRKKKVNKESVDD